MQIIPVILAGGSGKRLWPISRRSYPKQFLSLISEKTMFQETLARLETIKSVSLKRPVIVCNQDHRFLVIEQINELDVKYQAILVEPIGRNTAPAVAVAAHYIKSMGDDEVILLVLPADHQLSDMKAFDAVLETALHSASMGHLVTFGIEPREPHTGYGYIKKGEIQPELNLYTVDEFVEKPDQETAKDFLESGNYLWNSGMFMFKTSSYLEALKIFAPKILDKTKLAVDNSIKDMDFTKLSESEFAQSPSDSIDYAVMEKAINQGFKVNVISLDANWSDLGSWKSLWESSKLDSNHNVTKGDVVVYDSQSNYLYSESGLLATMGVKDVIVVQTSDAVLIADKKKSQNVSKIVDLLKNSSRQEVIFHRKVTRPWGTFDSIDESAHFKVKRLTVNPGAKLSLQMHHQREEFWVVVTGIAKVTRGEEVLTLQQSQTIHIPIGMKHSLENPGTIPLEIIEIQIGDYLGEDDIVRFDDRYGRLDD